MAAARAEQGGMHRSRGKRSHQPRTPARPQPPPHLPPARAPGVAGSGHWPLLEAEPQTLGRKPWPGSGRCPRHLAWRPPAGAGRFWTPPSPWRCAGLHSRGPGCPHPLCPAGLPGGRAQGPRQGPSPSPQSTQRGGLAGAAPRTRCIAVPRALRGRSAVPRAPPPLPAGWLQHRTGKGRHGGSRGHRAPDSPPVVLSWTAALSQGRTVAPTQGLTLGPWPWPSHLHAQLRSRENPPREGSDANGTAHCGRRAPWSRAGTVRCPPSATGPTATPQPPAPTVGPWHSHSVCTSTWARTALFSAIWAQLPSGS